MIRKISTALLVAVLTLGVSYSSYAKPPAGSLKKTGVFNRLGKGLVIIGLGAFLSYGTLQLPIVQRMTNRYEKPANETQVRENDSEPHPIVRRMMKRDEKLAKVWKNDLEHLARAELENKTEVVQKLVHILPMLRGKFLANSLVYYAHDGEARIGWLTGEDGDNKTIVPYTPGDIKKSDYRSIDKQLGKLADSLPIASNLDVVHKSTVAGELTSSSYPRYGAQFNTEDGIMVSGIIFAKLLPTREKSLRHADLKKKTHVILVTHRDGQELEARDRYFTIIPSYLNSKHGTPPLLPLDDVVTEIAIQRITAPMLHPM